MIFALRKNLGMACLIFSILFARNLTASQTLPELNFESGFEDIRIATIQEDSLQPIPGSTVSDSENVEIALRFDRDNYTLSGDIRVQFNGQQINSSCNQIIDRITCHVPAEVGTHTVQVQVGLATRTWSFTVGQSPKIISASPASGSSHFQSSPPEVNIHFRDLQLDLNRSSLRIEVDGVDKSNQAVLEWIGNREGKLRLQLSDKLELTHHIVSFSIKNSAELARNTSIFFYITVTPRYEVLIAQPIDGSTILDYSAAVNGEVNSNVSSMSRIYINGADAITGPYFPDDHRVLFRTASPIKLSPRSNSIDVRVVYTDGTEKIKRVRVNYDAPAVISLSTPRDFEIFGPVAPQIGRPAAGNAQNLTGVVERPIAIRGTLDRAVTSVMINQQNAELSPDRNSFTFNNFFLREGVNFLAVVATDELGRKSTTSRTVYVDQTAPFASLEHPTNNAITSSSFIDLRGVVNDAVEGGINAPEPTVLVKNLSNQSQQSATVADRYFFAEDVPLEVGANEIEIRAADSFGNERIIRSQIVRIAVGTNRIVKLSGDRQTAPISSLVLQPIVVQAIDKQGQALALIALSFDVQRGDGSIQLSASTPNLPDGVNPARNLRVLTDADGIARVWVKLGSEGLLAGNAIRVSHPEFAEQPVFTATGQRGAPAFVTIDGASSMQFATTNSVPVEPSSIVVFDESYNHMINKEVIFRIINGDASFNSQSGFNGVVTADGKEITVFSDKNGRAAVRPLIGPEPSTVKIMVRAKRDDGSLTAPMLLQLISLEPKSAPTQFGGIVLDHTGKALAGARVSIARTSLLATSNAQGKFNFSAQVPEGKIDLFVDARNVQSGSIQYPAIHFEATVIQGQKNQLPHPIYLPPIDLSRAVEVGGNADVSIKLPNYDGFEMIVKANSVTFPDGTHIGTLAVSPILADRLPMVPPGGGSGFGAIAWTIQPSGTRFDPPIQVKTPNSGGMKAGETVEFVQWDHDLGAFIAIGKATVSEDATQLVTDLGAGISKAGWGGCLVDCPPVPPNCAVDPLPQQCRGGICSGCSDCEKLDGTFNCFSSCIADPALQNRRCGDNQCKRCNGATCDGPFNTEKPQPSITVPDNTLPFVRTGSKEHADSLALFYGFESDDSAVKWDLEVKVQCIGTGKWKRHLTKASFQTAYSLTKSVYPNGVDQFTVASLNSIAEPNRCIKYNGAEYVLINQIHGRPGTLSSTEAAKWTKYKEKRIPWDYPFGRAGARTSLAMTVAHENEHTAQFFEVLIQPFNSKPAPWQTFLDYAITDDLTMTGFPTVESAQTYSDQKLMEAKEDLDRNLKELYNLMKGDYHLPKSRFANVELTVVRVLLARINALRTQHSCPQ